MGSVNTTKYPEVLFMPDFVMNALKSRGLNYTKFEQLILENNTTRENILPKLEEYISKQDLDMVMAANYLVEKFGVSGLLDPKNIEYAPALGTNLENFIELTKIYTDDSIDTSSIIMSKADDNIELPWGFHVIGDDIILVILQNSFCNFISYNIADFKIYFLEVLTNFMANLYGPRLINDALSTRTLIQHYFK